MSGLTLATASTDFTAPVVAITTPVNNASLTLYTPVTDYRTASDAGGVLVGVNISVDGWEQTMAACYRCKYLDIYMDTYFSRCCYYKVRGYDDSGNMGVPGAAGSSSIINVTGYRQLSLPVHVIYSPSSVTPQVALETDGQPIELGVKFKSSQAGYITGVRFSFGTETTTGWQTVSFTSPVAISANTTYIASYFNPSGYYSSSNPYFTANVVNGYLTGLGNGVDGTNGLYVYTTTGAFPANNFQSTNYW
ncbi:MAG: DUF4082 domain-containing protein [Bacteroidota bacterium]